MRRTLAELPSKECEEDEEEQEGGRDLQGADKHLGYDCPHGITEVASGQEVGLAKNNDIVASDGDIAQLVARECRGMRGESACTRSLDTCK